VTKLLVSVRNVDEARDALAGGADLIDIKEPARGSLGAAHPQTWEMIRREIGSRRPLSVALGELSSLRNGDVTSIPVGIAFAKIGLAGCGFVDNWHEPWTQSFEQFPNEVQPVAVVYSDWREARAPEPLDVVRRAAKANCRMLLIDTFEKSNGTSIKDFGRQQLEDIVAAARLRGLKIVLGGSITTSILPFVLEARPDYVAVRGSVCRGPRHGSLDKNLVREFAAVLNGVHLL
jgi:uncharacterized protein (UPF0264 family)